MKRDPLDLAVQALRDVTAGPPHAAAATRARILARAARPKRPRWLARVVLPIAAVLVVTSAWASTQGGLPVLAERVRQWIGDDVDATRADAPRRAEARASTASRTGQATPAGEERASESDAPRAPEVPEVSFESLPIARSSGVPVSAPASSPAPAPASSPVPAPASSPVPAAASDPPDSDLALYAAAHRAHFIDRDPAAALRAWDAYLDAQPYGRFVPEASYNRALALLRLGRRAEARDALTPFLDGVYGKYRTRDARELVRAMEDAGSR
jgi:hypothetical protein